MAPFSGALVLLTKSIPTTILLDFLYILSSSVIVNSSEIRVFSNLNHRRSKRRAGVEGGFEGRGQPPNNF